MTQLYWIQAATVDKWHVDRVANLKIALRRKGTKNKPNEHIKSQIWEKEYIIGWENLIIAIIPITIIQNEDDTYSGEKRSTL